MKKTLVIALFFVTLLLMAPLQASLSQTLTIENKSENYLAKYEPVSQNIDTHETTNVVIRVDSNLGDYIKEGKVNVKPIRAIDSFYDAYSGDNWTVHYYLLLFNLEFKHVGDIEGVILLRNQRTDELIVVYTQHGEFLIEKYSETPDTVYVNLERLGNAALSEDELISRGGWLEHMLIAAFAGASALYDSDRIGLLPVVTGKTDNQYELAELININWEDSTCKAQKLPEELRAYLERNQQEFEKKGYLFPSLLANAPEKLRVKVFELIIRNKLYGPFINQDFYESYLEYDDGKTYLSIKDLEQIATVEGKWSPYEVWKSHEIEAGGIDFTSVQLAYISEYSEEELEEQPFDFQYMFRATEAKPSDEISDLEEAKVLSLLWFLIGLSLPDDKFWVNLNPWESDRIIDEDLGRTDVGRIMLEADFQMKKDFCKYQNPCESDIGEEYWSLLEEKREELVKNCMNMYPGEIEDIDNVLFAVATRHWIVPDMITAYGDGDEFYIADAKLTIYSEPVFEHSTFEVVNQFGSISEGCSACLSDATKEYGKYAKELEEEMILPLVVEEVNNNSSYSDLRQVYCSLALAQWYKSRYRFGGYLFSNFIDSKNLANLESTVTWSPEEVWTEYVQSYEEGEFYCEKEYKEGDYIITRIYTAGGVDFLKIMEEISIIGSIDSEINETVSETMNKPLVKRNELYYFGDCISGSYDLNGDSQLPVDSIIEDYFEPIINTIKSTIEKYFVPIIIAFAILCSVVFVVVWSTRKKKVNKKEREVRVSL